MRVGNLRLIKRHHLETRCKVPPVSQVAHALKPPFGGLLRSSLCARKANIQLAQGTVKDLAGAVAELAVERDSIHGDKLALRALLTSPLISRVAGFFVP